MIARIAAVAGAIAALFDRRSARRGDHPAGDATVGTAHAPTARGTGRGNEWLAVLGHELRSPLAAILGYAELLDDGTFGPLDVRAADAVRRLRASAEHLVSLVEGMEAGSFRQEDGDFGTVDAATLLRDVASAVEFDATARNVTIHVEDGGLSIATRPVLAARALRLALGAAIKVSQGQHLRLAAGLAPRAFFTVAGTGLDPVRDDPAHAEGAGHDLTGAGLRLLLARTTAARAGGGLTLHADGAGALIRIEVPSGSD